MSMTLDGSNGVTFNDSSLQGAAASPFGLKNRLINSDMRIDQRNAGALINPAIAGYTVDRWYYYQSQTSKGTIGQNAGSVTPPTGYINYLGFTSTSAYSINSTDQFLIQQNIEGLNVADLAWGTANAKTITISFWVRSSLTGTFGGALQNSASNRCYPFSYTISTADTWTQISITIAGDTTGTWLTTNGTGIKVIFSLASGTAQSSTAGAWTGTSFQTSATGATSVVGTNGATFYITGVQLEVGSTATPFERRMYGQELALCQRYYQQYASDASSASFICNAYNDTSTRAFGVIQFPVIMRTPPTLNVISGTAFGVYAIPLNTLPCTSVTLLSSSTIASSIGLIFNVASGLTAGQGTVVKDNGTSASGRIQLNAEL